MAVKHIAVNDQPNPTNTSFSSGGKRSKQLLQGPLKLVCETKNNEKLQSIKIGYAIKNKISSHCEQKSVFKERHS